MKSSAPIPRDACLERRIPGKITSWVYMGSYEYKASGTWSPKLNLGLGSCSDPLHRPPSVSEARVVAPSDMIAIGESRLQKSNALKLFTERKRATRLSDRAAPTTTMKEGLSQLAAALPYP